MKSQTAATIRQIYQLRDRLEDARRVAMEWRSVVASTVGTDLHAPAVARFNAALAHEAALRSRRVTLTQRLASDRTAPRLLALIG